MHYLYLCVSLLILPLITEAQDRYITRQGFISFYSHTPVEDIEAVNNQVLSIVDLESGAVAVSMLMKSFQFEKALMQEHFNEKYVESDKYPKATFTGKIANLSDIDLSQDGAYTARVEGEVTIHGVTRPLTTDVEFVVADGTIRATGSFPLRVKD